MAKSSLFFITGVNGSGKSTLVTLLKKQLPANYHAHDIDEFGVPENVDSKWRQKQTRYWINIAKKIQERRSKMFCVD